ncbi:kinase-like domain-containing protein [Mycena vitilis]|nr:kinase-like domain-containing protein [Mycena vitilis]
MAMDSVVTKDQIFQAQVLKTFNLYQTYPDIYGLWAQHYTELIEDQPPAPWCVGVRFIFDLDRPDTLAWKILHYKADLPVYGENLEIDGDVVRRGITDLPEVPSFDDDEEYLDEDCTEELAMLESVAYDPSIHFAKKARFKAEITYLLLCRGCPHIVQLLGKHGDDLVFARLDSDASTYCIRKSRTFTIAFVKKLLLSLIDGLAVLHSKNIIHRDLTARNLLISLSASGDPEIIIIDLQCFAASYSAAPELRLVECANGQLGWDNKLFSFASDIYSLGVCLREFILPGHHRSSMMGFDVPAPFKDIYDACTQRSPENRPSLQDLRRMAEGIEE